MADDRPDDFGCADCWPPIAANAWEARPTLSQVAELIDESHFHVMILACPSCTQHFVSVFTEMIDWEDGDDPQYWTVMPITQVETVDLIKQRDSVTETTVEALGSGRRCLKRDHPKGPARHIFWGTGLILGPHD